MGADSVPRREVVTGQPAARASLRGPSLRPGPGPAAGSDTAAPDGTAPVRALVRRQARLALAASGLLTVLLGLLPVLLRQVASPDARGHVPLVVWLALGVAPYPVLLGIGRWYVRRAERHEDAYAGATQSRDGDGLDG
ncbi:hypothetical protein ACF1AY_25760 [Streptomyces sp. NPDC014776]|uniref:hypothetical protein n=1 Tax=Streptomyces sp. NPDC014776 TaxID=3364909 RepID=UPI0036F8FE3C